MVAAFFFPTFAHVSNYLILDFGNTSCKAAIFSHGELVRQERLRSSTTKQILDFIGLDEISAGIFASVIHHTAEFKEAIAARFPLIEVNSQTVLPFANAYGTPQSLGYDRIAAAAAAWQLFPHSPVLAVVAGTCLTYNIIDGENRFRGGAISPGLHMRRKAMKQFTSKLPLVEITNEIPLTGFSTETSMRSGIVHGTRAEIEGMIQAYSVEYPGLKTVIGGGDAVYLAKGLKNGIFARPNLVAEGLHCILNHHVTKKLF
jgi:type III pantothenate kinase